MCIFLAYFVIFYRVILPLQTYWSLSCDHGLHCIAAMSECENNTTFPRVSGIGTKVCNVFCSF